MAAAEYYASAPQMQGIHQPNPYAQSQPQLQQQYQQPPQQGYLPQQFAPSYGSNTPAPPRPSSASYFSRPQQNQQMQNYTSPPPAQGLPSKASPNSLAPPYPTTPPATGSFHHQRTYPKKTYPTSILKPTRSQSQPPRVHFADDKSDRSNSISSDSDSDASRRRRRRRRERRTRSNDFDSDDDYSRERTHRSRTHQKESKDRGTFLGAGAGGIIGDAIFPGLGTAAGLLLGGLSGRKYADSHSREEDRGHHHRRRDDRY